MRKSRTASLKVDTEEVNINLTPLIDVVFVVLIIFILIAPMLELDRVQLAAGAPKSGRDSTTVQENSPLAIHVHADNTIWYNGRNITAKELLECLKLAKKSHPQRIPQLFNDKKAYFETYQSVKNAVELAGFEQLDVILQPG